MDEYIDFVEMSLRDVAPARAARQKKLEERIRVPFRLVDAKVLKRNRRQPVVSGAEPDDFGQVGRTVPLADPSHLGQAGEPRA